LGWLVFAFGKVDGSRIEGRARVRVVGWDCSRTSKVVWHAFVFFCFLRLPSHFENVKVKWGGKERHSPTSKNTSTSTHL